jgi:hypothetical protein
VFTQAEFIEMVAKLRRDSMQTQDLQALAARLSKVFVGYVENCPTEYSVYLCALGSLVS